MAKLIGYQQCNFTAKDGTQVKGVNVYLEEPIIGNGKGLSTEKVYLSESKMAKMNIDIEALIGKEVRLSFNRWGKLDYITVIGE